MDAPPPRPDDAGAAERGAAREAAVLLALALAVGLVRFVGLGEWSFWYDEVLTLADARHGVERGELHNPLGYRLVRWTAALLGRDDELAWRLLPAIAGWLSIVATWWAFRPLAGARRASAAALFVAASSWALYWSQNARFYTLAALVSVLGAGVLVRGVLAGRAVLASLGLALVALAASFHLSAALVLGALGLALAALWVARREEDAGARRVLGRLVAVGAVCALACSPWIVGGWRTYLVSKQVPAGLGAKLASVAHFFASFGFFVTPLLGAAFVAGVLAGRRERAPLARLAVLVVVIGALAAAAASLFGRVTAQYAFCLLPWIALVAAAPLERFERPLARGAWILVLVLPALADQALYHGWRHGERPRWREAIEYVWQERGPTDLIASMAAPIAEHYLDPSHTELRRPEVAAWMDKWRPSIPQEWIGRGRRVWVIVQPENLEDWSGPDREALEAFLREECHLMRRFPVPAIGRDQSIEVYLYEGS